MLSWRDLGAGLAAAPRVMLRGGYWLEVVRRLLFSHVFLGYALVGGVLYAGSRALLGNPKAAGEGMMGLVMIAMMLGPFLVTVLAGLLLPYGLWVMNPAAARFLLEHLALPPARVAKEPPFFEYLLWSLPFLGLSLVTSAVLWVPAFNRGDLATPYLYATTALLALALIKAYTRSALAVHYPIEDIDRFLAATRWQRVVVWLPLSLGVGWALSEGVLRLALGLGLSPMWILDPTGPAALAMILAHVLVSVLVGITYVGALLLACGRMVGPVESGQSESAHSETLVMQHQLRRPPARPRTAAGRGWSWRRGLVVALVLVPAGLYLGRATLLDWYLGNDPVYQAAVDAVARNFAQDGRHASVALDATRRDDRLVAGYVMLGCKGRLDQARWIERVVEPTTQQKDWLLTCAVCNGSPATVLQLQVDWPSLPHMGQAMSTNGDWGRPRTALSCAAAANDVALAQALLQVNVPNNVVRGPHAALQVALERGHWKMAELLAARNLDPRDLPDAVLLALDQARARNPARPAEMLAGLRQAGLPLEIRDADQRNLFHHAAMWHDLALARGLLAQQLKPEFGPERLDVQGAQPWMYVLRRAERDGKPMSADATELLRLLLPVAVDVNLRIGDKGTVRPAFFPRGWNAGVAAISQPAAREILGPQLDYGLLPADPAQWWKFSGPDAAETFVRTATPEQLARVENPEAPDGQPAKKLSTALVEVGWTTVAEQLLAATAPKPEPKPARPPARK